MLVRVSARETGARVVSNWLLALCAAIYVGVAVGYARRGEFGMALAFLAYAVANVGFILANPGNG